MSRLIFYLSILIVVLSIWYLLEVLEEYKYRQVLFKILMATSGIFYINEFNERLPSIITEISIFSILLKRAFITKFVLLFIFVLLFTIVLNICRLIKLINQE